MVEGEEGRVRDPVERLDLAPGAIAADARDGDAVAARIALPRGAATDIGQMLRCRIVPA